MSGTWLGKGDANHGRERGRARARGSKRKQLQLVPVVETSATDFTEVQFTLFINLELHD